MFDPDSDKRQRAAEKQAETQRDYRARRKRGEREYRIVLNVRKLEQAIRARNYWSPNQPVSKQTIERFLQSGANDLCDSWIVRRRPR